MRRAITSFALLCLVACGDKPNSPTPPTAKPGSTSGNPVTAPVDYLGAVAKAKKHSEKTIDLASVRQAIQLFHSQEDKFPKDLQELVSQNFIREIPPAPYGMQYTYAPASGEVKIIAIPPPAAPAK